MLNVEHSVRKAVREEMLCLVQSGMLPVMNFQQCLYNQHRQGLEPPATPEKGTKPQHFSKRQI